MPQKSFIPMIGFISIMRRAIRKNFESLDVPKDALVYLGNIDELSQIIRSVAYEYQLMKEGHEECNTVLYGDLFVKACKTAKVYRQEVLYYY